MSLFLIIYFLLTIFNRHFIKADFNINVEVINILIVTESFVN